MLKQERKRHQFVFVAPCGCPTGVVEATPRMTESSAFNVMFEGARERSRALAAGIRIQIIRMPHEEYMATWYQKMLASCPHQ